MSAEIQRHFPKVGPRKTGERKHGKSRSQTDTPEMTGVETQTAKKGKIKYSGKTLEMKTVNRNLMDFRPCIMV
jgi:hypothetical protein